LSIQTFKPEKNTKLQITNNEPSQYQIHKLDINCDVIPSSDVVKREKNTVTQKPSWSHYYSNYDPTTMSPDVTLETTNEFVLTLKGNVFSRYLVF
jgi:hypothetical protein